MKYYFHIELPDGQVRDEAGMGFATSQAAFSKARELAHELRHEFPENGPGEQPRAVTVIGDAGFLVGTVRVPKSLVGIS